MIISEWPEGVNDNFFSLNSKPTENTENSSFLSGRVVAWQRNTKKTFTHSCKIMLDVDSEIPLFWAWFNDTLGQTAGAFYCSALGENLYRFSSVPTPDDTDRNKTVLNLEIEEV